MKKVSIKALQSGLMAILLFGTGAVRAQGSPILTMPTALRAFDEPLETLGAIPSKPESDAIRVALDEYLKAGVRDAMEPLELYLRAFPDSPWRASLRMNMGLAYKRAGWPGKAMANFEDAWRLAKADEGTVGRRIADRAVSEWMWLCVKAGDDIRLENLLREVGLRPMFGGSAQRRADAARALYAMQKEAKFYLCGPTALATVNQFLRPHRPVDPRDVKDTIPGVNGTSLFQLGMMAYNWDIPLQILKRSPGAKVLTPSVVHWKVGHWAAVLREAEGRYLVQEDVLEEAKWVSRAALDEETSGYCLAPFVPLPEGWVRVSAEEGKNVWGRGRVGIGPWFGPYPNSAIRPQMQPAPAVAHAGVRMGNLSLEIWFAPLSVPRSDGPAWPFEIRFQQRLAWQPDRPAFTHLGAHWTVTGVSYLEEEVDFERQDVHLYTETGSCLRFTGFDPDTGRYARNTHTRDLLVRIGAGLFALHRPDGTVETFAHRSPAGVGVQRVFMTERKVPMGPTQHFTFDGMTRLTSMRDAAGKGFDLRYEDPSDVWRLSRVVDVYGREARFIFNREGQLVRIVDARGRNTDFTFPENNRESDLVTGVATPEGGWNFRYGQENLDRWVELIDAEGRCHRAEFRHDAPGMPTTDADAPSGPLNQYMHDRSTYYWGPEALSRHRGDYKQAEAIRYLFNPTQLALSWTLEAVKQAKEPRIWFLYPGQVNTQVEGNRIRPRWVSQKYPEALSQWNLVWDDLGRLTEVSEKGGRAVFTYPDGPGTNPRSVRVDLQGTTLREEWDGAGRLLGRWRGNRRVWKAVRDERGTIRSISDTSGRVWKMTYDSSGRWTGIRGAASFEWTYDSLDRVASLRRNGGIPQSITYDELDQIQGVDRLTWEPPKKANRKYPFPDSVAGAKALAGVGIPEPPLSLPTPSSIRNLMNPRGGEREMQRGKMNKVTKGKKQLAVLVREWMKVIQALEPGLN